MKIIFAEELEKSLGRGFKLAFYRARKRADSRRFNFIYRGMIFEVFMDCNIYITVCSIYDNEGCLIAQVNDDNEWFFENNSEIEVDENDYL